MTIGLIVPPYRHTGSNRVLWLKYSDTMRQLNDAYYFATGTEPRDQRFLQDGRVLGDGNDDEIYGNTLVQTPILRGGKPVIYLFPPSSLGHVEVSVRLVPQWSFTHIYPIVGKTLLADGGERITWSVSVQSDGTLVDKSGRIELSYLFWEAASNPSADAPPSPPLSPRLTVDSIEHFNPAYPSLAPDSPTAVLLPSGRELLQYLDTTLRSLTLHTSARNDFITYWLPALEKHPFVALRFLPQGAYERAAELSINSPERKPDVVTRVFMLFRGLNAEEAGAPIWSAARERAGKMNWAEIVGVAPSAMNPEMFRVLEWGAMEVL